jgi:hypothetical protein
MNPQNNVDNSSQVGYNEGTNVENEFVDLVAMPPLNDLECQHETLVPEPEDTIGDAVYHGCTNPKCGRGWYIRPDANKNLS